MNRSVIALVLVSSVIPAPHLAAQHPDWASYNGTPEGTRYSTLERITAANARSLERICSFDSGEHMSMQSGPVVVGRRLYFTTDTSTYAIDAATCERIWQTVKTYEPTAVLKNNHGVAHMDGRLFLRDLGRSALRSTCSPRRPDNSRRS